MRSRVQSSLHSITNTSQNNLISEESDFTPIGNITRSQINNFCVALKLLHLYIYLPVDSAGM